MRNIKRKFYKSTSLALVAVTVGGALLFGACKKKETTSVEKELTYTEIDLVAENASDYTVVMPVDASECVQFAVDELVLFFKRATTHELTVEYDTGVSYDESQKIISVGETVPWQACGVELSLSEFGQDGVYITRKGSQVFLCGADDSGTLNSVYEFLELQFHFEAYAEDEIYIDEASSVKLLDFDGYKDIPTIRTRTGGNSSISSNPVYAARLRTCAGGSGKRYGATNAEFVTFAHTMQYLLPYKTYGAEHPDWYSSVGQQVCIPKYFTDALFKETFLSRLKEGILANPDSTAYQLGMNDSNAHHDRPETEAWTKEHGGYGGALMTFANAVARDIKVWLQEIGDERAETFRISVLAYIKYETAPVVFDAEKQAYVAAHTDVVAEENVSVMLAPYYASNAYAMDDADKNSRYKNLLEQWSVICDTLEIWAYTTNFYNYMIPYNNFQTYKENILAYEKYGVIYVMENGGNAISTPFQNLRNYVYAKLLWDPHQDYNKLVDDFIYYYYKDAAPYIKEYYDLIRVNYAVVEQQLAEEGKSLPSGMYEVDKQAGTTVWSLGFTKRVNALLDEAYEAAQGILDEEVRDIVAFRVKRERLSPRYFLLELHSTSLTVADCRRYIDQFEADAAECGLTRCNEGGSITPASLVEKWRAKLEI